MIFNSCKGSCDLFDNYLTSSLIEHVPKNKNVLRGNENRHRNKNWRRAIIKRLKLKDKAKKDRQTEKLQQKSEKNASLHLKF